MLRGDVTLKECGLVQEQMGHTRSNVKGTEEIKYHTRWTFVGSIFEETAVQEAPDKFQWHRTGGIKVHKGNFYDAYVQSCRGNGKASSQSTAFWSNLRKTTPEYGCGMTCFNNRRKAKVDRYSIHVLHTYVYVCSTVYGKLHMYVCIVCVHVCMSMSCMYVMYVMYAYVICMMYVCMYVRKVLETCTAVFTFTQTANHSQQVISAGEDK